MAEDGWEQIVEVEMKLSQDAEVVACVLVKWNDRLDANLAVAT